MRPLLSQRAALAGTGALEGGGTPAEVAVAFAEGLLEILGGT